MAVILRCRYPNDRSGKIAVFYNIIKQPLPTRVHVYTYLTQRIYGYGQFNIKKHRATINGR